MKPRFKVKYEEKIIAELTKKFGYKNALQVPKLEKIVLNMGVGEASQNKSFIESATKDLELIAGQKPVVNKARCAYVRIPRPVCNNCTPTCT